MSIPGELTPSQRILMGPGPSDVHPRVLRAMSTPLLGHLDPQFLTIMDEVKSMLQEILRTKNQLTIPVSGTGSAGMEACMVNLLEPGDEALICVHGYFGVRMADIASRCGAKVIRVDSPWGQPTDPARVEDALKTCSPKVIFVVHAETSTGVLQPIAPIAAIARKANALLVVDAVTSLGGTDVRMDEWGIDAIYSGTQKCLSAPPGLSPVSFSERAVAAIDARKSKVQSWYLDMTMVKNYWGQERVYHHTAPITSVYAIREALRIALEEGLEARFARHLRAHDLLREQLETIGFEFIVAPEFRLPMLNTVRIPAGVEDLPTRKRLLAEYNIEIGGGLGDFAGKAWRIGLMGNGATENQVNVLVSALKRILNR